MKTFIAGEAGGPDEASRIHASLMAHANGPGVSERGKICIPAQADISKRLIELRLALNANADAEASTLAVRDLVSVTLSSLSTALSGTLPLGMLPMLFAAMGGMIEDKWDEITEHVARTAPGGSPDV